VPSYIIAHSDVVKAAAVKVPVVKVAAVKATAMNAMETEQQIQQQREVTRSYAAILCRA